MGDGDASGTTASCVGYQDAKKWESADNETAKTGMKPNTAGAVEDN